MAHDVFISHSAKDKPTADAACAMLESQGIRCWIAPRDVVPGMEWGECIIEAIEQTRIMVLVFTADANGSAQIRREVERAVNHGVAILPFRIENVAPGRALEYFIGNVHWLDALTPPLEEHLKNLTGTIKVLLARMGPRKEGVVLGSQESVAQTAKAADVAAAPAYVQRPPESAPQQAPAQSPYGGLPPGFIPAPNFPAGPQNGGVPQYPTNLSGQAGASKIPQRNILIVAAVAVGLIALVVLGRKSKQPDQQPAAAPTTPAVLTNTNLNSIFGANDGHRLWLVGDAGMIAESDDDGKTWMARASGATRSLNWVFATSDGKHLWAVGDSGTILRSTNGGTSWETAPANVTADLYSVFAADDARHVWAVGASGTILASTDGGASWSTESSGAGMWLWAIRGTSDGSRLWVAGAWGTFVESSDSGATWHDQVINSNENVHSLYASSDGGRVWAVGNDGNAWESTDGGTTWTSKNTSKGGALLAIYGSGDGRWLTATGTGGTVLRSDHDDGFWSPQVSGTSQSLNSVFGSGDGTYLWAVGNSGTVLRSINGGQNWTK